MINYLSLSTIMGRSPDNFLNLAGLLADRLQKENSVVSMVKMDLDVAISSLRTASEEDNLKTIALKELQSKVDSLNHATRVRKENLSKRSHFNWVSVSSLAVASLAVIGMAGLYNSYDHDAPDRLVTLTKELDNFKSNESFYLELKIVSRQRIRNLLSKILKLKH